MSGYHEKYKKRIYQNYFVEVKEISLSSMDEITET